VKYLVWEKYYESGRVTGGIEEITEEEANNLVKKIFTRKYDLYNNVFDTLEKAKEYYSKTFLKDCPLGE